MIIDGKKIADEVIASLEKERALLPGVVRLGVLMSEGDKATDSFVRIKEKVADRLRVVIIREMLGEDATTEEALRALERLASRAGGIIVQLPLPKNIDTQVVLKAIPKEKDVDFVRPPVGEAIAEVLKRSGLLEENNPDAQSGPRLKRRGKAVVVGAGRLVGKPAADVLKELGADVSVITTEQGSFTELLHADIVVSGAGSPGLIQPHMLNPGVELIDAGTREARGRVAGDCDPACAEVASVFTPVPGGIGPIAVAMIFKNLFALQHQI